MLYVSELEMDLCKYISILVVENDPDRSHDLFFGRPPAALHNYICRCDEKKKIEASRGQLCTYLGR
jgi:hypothetical protein